MAFTLDQFRLDGKVAVVTGAGGRGNSIGRAYAFGMSNAGASVVVADLNGDGAKAVADEINAAGGIGGTLRDLSAKYSVPGIALPSPWYSTTSLSRPVARRSIVSSHRAATRLSLKRNRSGPALNPTSISVLLTNDSCAWPLKDRI